MDIPSLVAQIASQLGVPSSIAVAQAQDESDFDPNAVSPAGAIGVMQLMPKTAAGLGVTDPRDPTQSITGGLTYDLQLLAMFGDWETALAAYDWGEGNVRKAIASYGSNWLSHAPSETQKYVAKILGAEVSTDGSDGDGSDSGASAVLPVVAAAAVALVFLF